MNLVELCGGMASLSLWVHSRRPPASRVGSKAGYAHAIAEPLGLKPDASPCLVVEADPACARAMRALVSDAARLAREIEERAHGEPRKVWRAARELRAESPAAWWIWTSGARGGIGGFKGRHKRRPSVDGFIPSRESLVRRIRRFSTVSGIEVIEASADEVEPIPGAVVYIDPPYKGRQPYGPSFPREAVVRAANRWARAGCVVAISEAEPIEIEGAKHIDLTAARRGQARRSLTVGAAEWLTMIGGE